MKKSNKFIALISISLFVAFGCNKNEFDYSESSNSVIYCDVPSNTKAYVDGIQTKWQAGDQIYVVKGTTEFIYTLNPEDAGKTRGSFTCPTSTIKDGDDVIAFYGKKYQFASTYMFLDVDAKPTLFGYNSSDTPSSSNSLKVPMVAKGKFGETLSFEHASSLLRIVISNNTDSKVTIKRIALHSNEGMSVRIQFTGSKGWIDSISKGSEATIFSDGSVALEKDATKTFDFVVFSGSYNNVVVDIYDSNDNKYQYKKSTLTVEKGCIYSFETSLSSTKLKNADVKLSVNDGADVAYNFGEELPTPASSIVVKPNTSTVIGDVVYKELVNQINSQKLSVVLDLRQMSYTSNTWNINFGKLDGLYLPNNITTLSNDRLASQAPNLKLYLASNLTKITSLLIFQHDNYKCAEGCGFFVDEGNENYSSVNGVLYDKAKTTLYQVPNFEVFPTIENTVTTVAPWAIARNIYVSSIVYPAVSEVPSYAFTNCTSLKEITFTTMTPPDLESQNIGKTGTAGEKGTAVDGTIIINTGNADNDIIAKTNYMNAWKNTGEGGTVSKIGSWVIKTKAEVDSETKCASSLPEMQKDNSYNNKLW